MYIYKNEKLLVSFAITATKDATTYYVNVLQVSNI